MTKAEKNKKANAVCEALRAFLNPERKIALTYDKGTGTITLDSHVEFMALKTAFEDYEGITNDSNDGSRIDPAPDNSTEA